MVHRQHTIGLIVGLSWSVLSSDADQLSGTALRDKTRRQGRLLGARQYVLSRLPHVVHLGLYTPPVLSRETPPRHLHALATVFLAAFAQVDKSTVNAILLMPADGDDERRALVVIEGGQVVHDRLERTSEALGLVQKYRQTSGLLYTVFSHYPEVPDASTVTWSQLLGHTSKVTQLHGLPRNVWLWLSATLLILTGLLALAWYQWVVAPEKARVERLAKAARDNQTPQYLQKLAQGLARSGWQRADLMALLQAQTRQTVYDKGWALSRIDCDLDSARCEYRYERVGGEIAELIARTVDKTYDVAASNKDLAVLVQTLTPAVQALQRQEVPQRMAAAVTLRTALQRLSDAGISSHQGPPKPWPAQGLDMNKVDKSVVVQQNSLEWSLPWPLAADSLQTLPPFVGVRSMTVDLKTGSEKADWLRVSFKGHSYGQ
jgi:hypothetical protein